MIGNDAVKDGGRSFRVRSRGTALILESILDLEGRPQACWARIDEGILSIGSKDGPLRQWSLTRIKGFRAESLVGSCFVQGKVGEEWIDLLRLPGAADESLLQTLDAWNSRLASPDWRERVKADSVDAAVAGDDRGVTRDETSHGWLWRLVRPFMPSILLLLGLSALAVGIEIIPPLLQKALVDEVLAETASGSREQLLYLLLAIVGGLLLVRVASTAVGIWKGYVSSRIGATMTANLRNQLVRKLNDVPLAYHDRNQVGVLMSQVAYDTETLHTLIYHLTSGLLLQSFQLVGISIALFYLNAKLALVTLLPMPLILAGSWYFTRHLQPRQHHYWEAVGKQASALMGMLAGMRVVKAFVQEDREIARFCRSSERLRDSRRTVDFSTSTFTAAMGLLFALGALAVWYIGGRDVLFGSMTLGSLMAFLAYLAMFYTPLTSVAESTTWFANFIGTGRRISAVLQTRSENDASAFAQVGRGRGHVELRDVWFGYDKSRPVLRDVSLTIESGQMIGIVGRSGSGKSTLVSLIGRLYQPDSGEILLDGINTRRYGIRDIRRQMGMVPQEPFLFRASIAENIAYGNAAASPRDIIAAAKQADAHAFVLRTPLAYSTPLGEGGTGLSGGERQRLSIARALLFDPAILILDEATASVDAESERAICDALRRWTQTRTAIVVSHRLSTLRGADRLCVFDAGKLVEQGTHEELLEVNGIYAKLARIQGNLEGSRHSRGKGPHSRIWPEGAIDGYEGSNGDVAGDIAEEFLFSDSSADASVSTRGDTAAGGADWLDPANALLEAIERPGMLRLTTRDRVYQPVMAMETFPGKHPGQYISLQWRDAVGQDRECGLLERLDVWPPAAQEAVRRSLRRRYLLRTIREIRQIKTRENVLTMSVLTDAGCTALRLEKPGQGSQPFADHGVLLTDSRGNYFVIHDRATLPRWQQRLLALYFGE